MGSQPSQLLPVGFAHPPTEAATQSSIAKAINFMVRFLSVAEVLKRLFCLPGPLLGATSGQELGDDRPGGEHEAGDPENGLPDTGGGEERDQVHSATGARFGQIAGTT